MYFIETTSYFFVLIFFRFVQGVYCIKYPKSSKCQPEDVKQFYKDNARFVIVAVSYYYSSLWKLNIENAWSWHYSQCFPWLFNVGYTKTILSYIALPHKTLLGRRSDVILRLNVAYVMYNRRHYFYVKMMSCVVLSLIYTCEAEKSKWNTHVHLRLASNLVSSVLCSRASPSLQVWIRL